MTTRFEALRGAIQNLQDASDADWTDSGEPRLSRVAELAGPDLGEPPTRNELAKFARFRREQPPVQPEPLPLPRRTKRSVAEAAANVATTEAALLAAHQQVRELTRTTKIARAALANATTAFLGCFAPQNREQLQRDHIKAEQARLQRIHDGTEPQPPYVRPPSLIDAFAKNTAGGQGARRGYNFRRGATTVRGTVKPPSER